MKKRKILYITGTRADFGRARYILKTIKNDKKFSVFILAVGNHLSSHFGYTIEEVKREFPIAGKVKTVFENDDTIKGMLNSFSRGIIGITKFVDTLKPDLIIVLGDRGEMLAGAVIGAHMNILVAHIGGGHITGSIDDKIRDGITVFSDIHFVATKRHAKRVIDLGAQKQKVYIVGAPDLEIIRKKDFTSKDKIYKKLKLDSSGPIILLSQHPVTAEYYEAPSQMRIILEALENIPGQIIATYPNEDAGGRKMTKILKSYTLTHPRMSIYKHINYLDYLGLMNVVSVMVGNSSAGIIEAASFGLPVVNIGTRQKGRERAENVIDVGYSESEIRTGIKKCLFDKEFLKRIKKNKNPYGDGKTSQRIFSILKKILFD